MMRQAVPLLNPEIAIVGTGIEDTVARDSRILINAEGEGVVEYVDANEIVIRIKGMKKKSSSALKKISKVYRLTKFQQPTRIPVST